MIDAFAGTDVYVALDVAARNMAIGKILRTDDQPGRAKAHSNFAEHSHGHKLGVNA